MEYRQTTFSKISNTIFLIATIFVLSFIWVNYYTKKFSLSLISAAIICTALIIIYFCKYYFEKKKSETSKSKTENELNIKNYLQYSRSEENAEYIFKIFGISNAEKIDINHYIDQIQKIDYFFNFSKDIVTLEEIINYYKTRKYDGIVLFCISTEKFDEIESCNFEIVDFEKIKDKIQFSGKVFPIINIKKTPKIRLKDILCTVLCKNKSKGYFWFGIMLILTSFITIYSSYYIVIGSCLLLLSIFSRFNSTFNKKTLP